MSKIITPTDTLTITIDNRQNPATCTMTLSRDLPAPYVAIILSQMITRIMGNVMAGLNSKTPVNTGGNLGTDDNKS